MRNKYVNISSKLCYFVVMVLFPFTPPWGRQVGNTAEGASAEDQLRLLQRFLNDSYKSIRPVKSTLDPVQVTFDITFHSVIELDEKHQILSSNIWVLQDQKYQILSTNMWVLQIWTNEFFQWDPKEYGGLEHVVVESSDIWLPDITLYNNVFEEFDGRMDHIQTRVQIQHDGTSRWAAPFVFKTSCHIDVSDFPFDDQFCRLKFGSWRYEGSELDLLKSRDFSSKTKTSVENGEWEVRNVTIRRNSVKYACCPNKTYPDVTFTIHLKRRSMFYIVNLILPNCLIALLGFFSFFIPVECGERISFVITVLLSMTVFLLLVAENIPPTSDAVPVIGVFYTMSIIEIALALVATGVTLKIYHSHLYGHGLSPRVKSFIFDKLGPLLRFPAKNPLIKRAEKASNAESNDGLLRVPKIKEETLKKDNVKAYAPHKEARRSEESAHEGVRFCGKHAFGNGRATVVEPDVALGTDVQLCHLNLCASAPELEAATKDSAREDPVAQLVRETQTPDAAAAESRLASAIVDTAFMWLFFIVFIVSTAAVLLLPTVRKLTRDNSEQM